MPRQWRNTARYTRMRCLAKASPGCGTVKKKTQHRSPVRAWNARTVPGGSNVRYTPSAPRLPTITGSSNTTGAAVWSNS